MDLRQPLLSCGVIAAGMVALAVASGQAGDPWLLLGLPLAVLPLWVFVVWWGARPPGAFLAGMRDAGAALEVQRDAGNWFGGREVRLRGPGGAWHLETWNGGTIQLWVTPPGAKEPYLVQTRHREAGRKAVEKARLGTREAGEDER